MKLYLIRHGQTDMNKRRKYQGSIETDLNQQGIVQAQRAAEALPANIDALVSSPMRRALQTAEIISTHTGIPIDVMPQFRERAFGLFEGLSKTEIKHRFPDLWKHKPLRSFDVTPPGGESVDDVLERVRQGMEELLATHGHGQVAVVAHGFVARAIRGLTTTISRDTFFDYTLANGDCATFSVRKPLGMVFEST